jgi:hypothetical protein
MELIFSYIIIVGKFTRDLDGIPFTSELMEAYEEGIPELMRYLRNRDERN